MAGPHARGARGQHRDEGHVGPLPQEYDLWKLQPLKIEDEQHEIAKTIFNRRTTSAADLTEGDVTAEPDELGPDGQMQVLVILFYMFGTKLGSLKHRTGIE